MVSLGFARLGASLAVSALLASAPFPAEAAQGQAKSELNEHIASARELMVKDPAAALNQADAAIRLAPPPSKEDTRKIEGTWLRAQALNRLGNQSKALEAAEPALSDARRLAPGSSLEAELYYTRASISDKLGDVKSAASDLQISNRLFQSLGDNQGQAKTLLVIAAIYRNAGDYTRAKSYYDQSINLYDGDVFFKIAVYNNRAILLTSMKDYKAAKSDFLSALKFSEDNQFPSFIEASILTNLASAEIRSGELRSARIHLERGLRVAESPEAARERPFLNAVKAELLFSEGMYSASASLLDEVFQGKNFEKTTPAYKYFHELASDVYSKVGRNDVALQHFQAFKRLDDEARELMVNTNSALVAAQFDFANQDLKIARLQSDQLKKDAELARSRNRITLIALGGLAITAGLLGFNFLSLRRSSRRTTTANTQLSKANQALETALKARSEFLATTSHEIRTPLNGILGVTQVLLSDPGLSAEVRDRISLMNGAGETMRAMVNDLLDMAKIESGTLTIEKGETDLNGLLDDAVNLWTDKAREKDLDLVIDRSGAPGRILEDGLRLRQIVFNLLSNAIKFTEAGSVRLSVGVETAGIGERLILRVTDTGIGIPSDKLDAIFESFQQVDGGVTRRFEGTGLGLSISRRLAEAMGGTLGVESRVGEGSTFTLILPLVRAGAAAAASAGASSGGFLIIEANPLTQSVLKSVAAPLGLPVETTASPETAAEVLSGGYTTLVLVDAAALGADREARVAAIAGLVAAGARGLAVTWPSPDPEDIEAALAAGAVKVIAKPISAARLTEALLTLLPESA